MSGFNLGALKRDEIDVRLSGARFRLTNILGI